MDGDENTERELARELRTLREEMVRINDARRRFFIGVLSGLGGALGASIVAAPLIVAVTELLTELGLLN